MPPWVTESSYISLQIAEEHFGNGQDLASQIVRLIGSLALSKQISQPVELCSRLCFFRDLIQMTHTSRVINNYSCRCFLSS